MTMIDTAALPPVPVECLWRWRARCWPAPTCSRGSRVVAADVDPVLGLQGDDYGGTAGQRELRPFHLTNSTQPHRREAGGAVGVSWDGYKLPPSSVSY